MDNPNTAATANKTAAEAERKHELIIFLFLSVFLAPIVSVIGIGGYGLLIWILQLLS